MQKATIWAILIITVLALSLSLIVSTKPVNAQAAYPSPTSTHTPTPTPTITPTQTPTPTPTLIPTAEFGFNTIGQEVAGLVEPKTYTLSNFTTPFDMGNFTEISIYLVGVPEGSQVKAVIFANEPDAHFPKGGEPITESNQTLTVKSITGQWYNFTINYQAHQNTTYWIGYYSEGYTRYFLNENTTQLTVTSQPKEDGSQWLPVSWHYTGKATISLYALYTTAPPEPEPTQVPNSVVDNPVTNYKDSAIGIGDIVFVSVIMFSEFGVVLLNQKSKKQHS